MQSVKFRSVISPLLFHARARGRRVGQLEAPAGKCCCCCSGAEQGANRRQFCGPRTLLPSAIWGPHVGVSRSLAACDWRARLVFLAKHLMEHRCGVALARSHPSDFASTCPSGRRRVPWMSSASSLFSVDAHCRRYWLERARSEAQVKPVIYTRRWSHMVEHGHGRSLLTLPPFNV